MSSRSTTITSASHCRCRALHEAMRSRIVGCHRGGFSSASVLVLVVTVTGAPRVVACLTRPSLRRSQTERSCRRQPGWVIMYSAVASQSLLIGFSNVMCASIRRSTFVSSSASHAGSLISTLCFRACATTLVIVFRIFSLASSATLHKTSSALSSNSGRDPLRGSSSNFVGMRCILAEAALLQLGVVNASPLRFTERNY